jgi:hypothetical protein
MKCPWCGADNLDGGTMKCLSCGTTWLKEGPKLVRKRGKFDPRVFWIIAFASALVIPFSPIASHARLRLGIVLFFGGTAACIAACLTGVVYFIAFLKYTKVDNKTLYYLGVLFYAICATVGAFGLATNGSR